MSEIIPSTDKFIEGISNIGNTSGTSGTVSNRVILAGGNNVTLSQNMNGQSATITISAFNQSEQTQNRFDLTLSGNTAGALALISSGTMTLAGGNNITLSQAGNAVTISAGGGAGTTFSAGVSTLGNTSGSTGTVSNQIVFAGGNNITLSQSTNAGGSATITISAFNQSEQTQNRFDLTLSGNTSGALALISSGTMTLAGGNNVTLSQAGNAVTISAANTSGFDLTLSGNTAGALALISSGTLTLAGGNSITLSQAGNAITISGATTSQSEQTQNRFDLTLSGNTSGALALISSGTMTLAGGNNVTLSQAGNAVTISAANTSGFDLTLSGNTSGALALISSGTLTLAGGNNITLSQAGNAVTISAGGGAVPSLTYWGNGDQTINTINTSNGTFWLIPLNPSHDIFPGNMTANTALLNFSNNDGAASRSFTHSWKIGIYTITSVSLSLLNSIATSWGSSADNATNNSLFSGERFLTIHSSAWSVTPTFSQTQYFVGLVGNSSGNVVNFSIFGHNILKSDVVRSGTIQVSVSSGNTSMGQIPFIGVSSASRNITAGLPTSIQLSELVKTGALYGFIPHIQFNNISSNF